MDFEQIYRNSLKEDVEENTYSGNGGPESLVEPFEDIYRLNEAGAWMEQNYDIQGNPLYAATAQIQKIMNMNIRYDKIYNYLKNWTETGEAGEEKRFACFLLDVCSCVSINKWRSGAASEEDKQKVESIMKICSGLLNK